VLTDRKRMSAAPDYGAPSDRSAQTYKFSLWTNTRYPAGTMLRDTSYSSASPGMKRRSILNNLRIFNSIRGY